MDGTRGWHKQPASLREASTIPVLLRRTRLTPWRRTQHIVTRPNQRRLSTGSYQRTVLYPASDLDSLVIIQKHSNSLSTCRQFRAVECSLHHMFGQRKQPSFSWDPKRRRLAVLGPRFRKGNNLWRKACLTSISGPGCSPTMFNQLVGTTEYVLYNNGVEDSQRSGWATGHGILWGSSDLWDSSPGLQQVGLPKSSSGFSWQPILQHWYTPGQHDKLVDHKSRQVRLTSLAREQLSRSTLWGTPLVPQQHPHIRAERLERPWQTS